MLPGTLMTMLGMISLVATTEAHRLTVPNGTSADLGNLEPTLGGLEGLACAACGWEESTQTTWALILLVAAVVATLLARVQHLENLMEDQPIKSKPTTSALPATNLPTAPEADFADIVSRLQRLEENKPTSRS